MTSTVLPLELELRAAAEAHGDKFPSMKDSFWTRYDGLVNYLRRDVYPFINAGLACLSKSPGIFTDHGADHFDEVVRYAGLLLKSAPEPHGLEPYELYVLLCAIRLHDAGNLEGREEHEKRALKILLDAGAAVCRDISEARLIADIAEAHGGKRPDGDKDTIGVLHERTTIGAASCRPRLLAALVRFADEICEHSNRASEYQLESGTLPPTNQLFHLYAHSVKGVAPVEKEKTVHLQIAFDEAHLLDKFPTARHLPETPDHCFLLDEVVLRLEKLDRERRYCNRFLTPHLQTEKVKVDIEFHRDGGRRSTITADLAFSLTDGTSYPDAATVWWPNKAHLDGLQYSTKLRGTVLLT